MSETLVVGTLEPELDPVARWRLEQLLRAGYGAEDALALALDVGVDLHRATELVQAGCSPAVAVRILA
jgi:hypothetical protein